MFVSQTWISQSINEFEFEQLFRTALKFRICVSGNSTNACCSLRAKVFKTLNDLSPNSMKFHRSPYLTHRKENLEHNKVWK